MVSRHPSTVAAAASVALAVIAASLAGSADLGVVVSAFQSVTTTTTTTTHITTTSISSATGRQSSPTALFANSKNIKAAMEATEMYGIHSTEARLAWEVVEEFDASTNDSAAYEADEQRGLTPEQLRRAYQDLQTSMEIMQRNQYAAVSFRNNQQLMKDVAAELKAIKLSPPAKQPSPKIPGLWDSKLKARAVTQQFGVDSPEAKLAWEEVEEIASSGLERAVGGDLFEEGTCDLVQAAQACMALEELDRFLYYENYHVGDNLENNSNDNTEGYDQYNNYSEQNYDENYYNNQTY